MELEMVMEMVFQLGSLWQEPLWELKMLLRAGQLEAGLNRR